MERRHTEVHEYPKKSFRAADILERIFDNAQPPLELVDAVERLPLAEWYRSHFKELQEDQQTQLLEGFISQGLLDDAQTFSVISEMTRGQRGQIASFIGSTIDGMDYMKTFQRCFLIFPKVAMDMSAANEGGMWKVQVGQLSSDTKKNQRIWQ